MQATIKNGSMSNIIETLLKGPQNLKITTTEVEKRSNILFPLLKSYITLVIEDAQHGCTGFCYLDAEFTAVQ